MRKYDEPDHTMNKNWNFHPKFPIGFYPFFEWPLSPKNWIKFIWNYWLKKSDRTILLLIALFTYFFLFPHIEEMANLKFGWISMVALRNYALVFLVAGGLHWWFFTYNGQGKKFQYDTSYRNKQNKKFTFNNHVYDNMFWTLVYGVPIWIFFEVLLLFSFASGNIKIFNFSDGLIWFCIWFPLLQIWQSFHFYCYHRALHISFFYKIAHSVHHRNINPGPWSGYSMHPIEQIIYISSLLIHFFIPSHPLHILYHAYWLVLGTISTHAGYEYIWIKNKNFLNVGSFFHHLHHRYFNCNFGNPEIPFDRWFGTYHDGIGVVNKRMKHK